LRRKLATNLWFCSDVSIKTVCNLDDAKEEEVKSCDESSRFCCDERQDIGKRVGVFWQKACFVTVFSIFLNVAAIPVSAHNLLAERDAQVQPTKKTLPPCSAPG